MLLKTSSSPARLLELRGPFLDFAFETCAHRALSTRRGLSPACPSCRDSRREAPVTRHVNVEVAEQLVLAISVHDPRALFSVRPASVLIRDARFS
jgi:hypothetical protein